MPSSTPNNMPAAEVEISQELVVSLVADQHPDLADLAIRPLAHGWDNETFRLGYSLIVRLPRRAASAELLANEQRALPLLAPLLPLPIPVPVRLGRPTADYPWAWSITPWFPGSTAAESPPQNAVATARRLGDFLSALHQPAPAEAPTNEFRGVGLAVRDRIVRKNIDHLGDRIDRRAVEELWHSCLRADAWPGPPVWIHGDLHLANLIVDGGELSAVIDFGDVCSGDPATDLAVGWMLFTAQERLDFRRSHLSVDDDATWVRARGWALAFGLVYSATSADNPAMAAIGERLLAESLSG